MRNRIEVSVDLSEESRPEEVLRVHAYLLRALEAAGATLRFHSRRVQLAWATLNRGLPGFGAILNLLQERPEALKSSGYTRFTVTEAGGCQARFVFDASDVRQLRWPDAVAWCDTYFKQNWWPNVQHPSQVAPFMNPNPLLRVDHLDELRSLRNEQRTRDVVFWSKIWEPGTLGTHTRGQCDAIIEHQVRTFEAIARVRGAVDLLAIVPDSLQHADPRNVGRRLESAGVVVQSGWGSVTTRRLWQGLASARVVPLRSGNHLAISWRMTDLLAMGACIVYDGAPYPNWHVPLVADEHYAQGGCSLSPEYELPADDSFRGLTESIEALLADDDRCAGYRRRAAQYFDAHCTPEMLGRFVLDRATARRPFRA